MADKSQTPQLKQTAPEDPEALVALGNAGPLKSDSLSRTMNVLGWLLAGLIVWLSYALASRVLAHLGEQLKPPDLRPPSVELKGLDELYRSMEQEKHNPLYTEGVDKLKGQLTKTESQLQEMVDKAKSKSEKGKRSSANNATSAMERF